MTPESLDCNADPFGLYRSRLPAEPLPLRVVPLPLRVVPLSSSGFTRGSMDSRVKPWNDRDKRKESPFYLDTRSGRA